jgi:hypothetical protein
MFKKQNSIILEVDPTTAGFVHGNGNIDINIGTNWARSHKIAPYPGPFVDTYWKYEFVPLESGEHINEYVHEFYIPDGQSGNIVIHYNGVEIINYLVPTDEENRTSYYLYFKHCDERKYPWNEYYGESGVSSIDLIMKLNTTPTPTHTTIFTIEDLDILRSISVEITLSQISRTFKFTSTNPDVLLQEWQIIYNKDNDYENRWFSWADPPLNHNWNESENAFFDYCIPPGSFSGFGGVDSEYREFKRPGYISWFYMIARLEGNVETPYYDTNVKMVYNNNIVYDGQMTFECNGGNCRNIYLGFDMWRETPEHDITNAIFLLNNEFKPINWDIVAEPFKSLEVIVTPQRYLEEINTNQNTSIHWKPFVEYGDNGDRLLGGLHDSPVESWKTIIPGSGSFSLFNNYVTPYGSHFMMKYNGEIILEYNVLDDNDMVEENARQQIYYSLNQGHENWESCGSLYIELQGVNKDTQSPLPPKEILCMTPTENMQSLECIISELRSFKFVIGDSRVKWTWYAIDNTLDYDDFIETSHIENPQTTDILDIFSNKFPVNLLRLQFNLPETPVHMITIYNGIVIYDGIITPIGNNEEIHFMFEDPIHGGTPTLFSNHAISHGNVPNLFNYNTDESYKSLKIIMSAISEELGENEMKVIVEVAESNFTINQAFSYSNSFTSRVEFIPPSSQINTNRSFIVTDVTALDEVVVDFNVIAPFILTGKIFVDDVEIKTLNEDYSPYQPEYNFTQIKYDASDNSIYWYNSDAMWENEELLTTPKIIKIILT